MIYECGIKHKPHQTKLSSEKLSLKVVYRLQSMVDIFDLARFKP